MDTIEVQERISARAQLALPGSEFVRAAVALHGERRVRGGTATPAALARVRGAAVPKSSFVVVGAAPDGFGKQVLWDPADAALAVVVFLNPGDPLGVMISGVQATDSIRFVSASGIGSFDEDTKNAGVSSLIGIAAAGATATAAAFGAPELAPVINAAAAFAKDKFKEEKVRTMRRDPFGQDPGTGHRARAEGGVLISMPAAGRTYYSGNSDHKERWIKDHRERTDANRPNHVKDAFFLRTGTDRRTTDQAGDIIVYPWDHKFEDNLGVYRLHILLTRGRRRADAD